jgi:hypothetical protein
MEIEKLKGDFAYQHCTRVRFRMKVRNLLKGPQYLELEPSAAESPRDIGTATELALVDIVQNFFGVCTLPELLAALDQSLVEVYLERMP